MRRQRREMAERRDDGVGRPVLSPSAISAVLLLAACTQDLALTDSVVDANRAATEAVALTPRVAALRERVENMDRAQSRLFQQINALAASINALRAEDDRLRRKIEELAARDAAESEKARRARVALSRRITALSRRVEEVLKVAIEARNGLGEIRRELAGRTPRGESRPAAWGLHLASYRSRAEAAAGWAAMKAELHENVNDLQANVIEVSGESGTGKHFRLVVGPFADKPQAERRCAIIRKRTNFCEVVGFSASGDTSALP